MVNTFEEANGAIFLLPHGNIRYKQENNLRNMKNTGSGTAIQ
jgi:hypothetical protein